MSGRFTGWIAGGFRQEGSCKTGPSSRTRFGCVFERPGAGYSSIRTRFLWIPALRSAAGWHQAPNAWHRLPASDSSPHPQGSLRHTRHRDQRHKDRRHTARTRDPTQAPLRDHNRHAPVRSRILRLSGNPGPSRLRGRIRSPGPKRSQQRLFQDCSTRGPNRSWGRILQVLFRQIQASCTPPFKKVRPFRGGAFVFRPSAAGSSAPPRCEGPFPPPGHLPQWPGPRPGSCRRSVERRS